MLNCQPSLLSKNKTQSQSEIQIWMQTQIKSDFQSTALETNANIAILDQSNLEMHMKTQQMEGGSRADSKYSFQLNQVLIYPVLSSFQKSTGF